MTFQLSLRHKICIALGVIVMCSILFWSQISRTDTQDLIGNINVVSMIEGEINKLANTIKEKNFENLIYQFQDFTNIKLFFDTLEECSVIQNIHITELQSGFWISFLCAHGGDTLHPYFGFFQQTPERKVLWGKIPRGKLLSEQVSEEDNQKLLAIENMSDMAWDAEGNWMNFNGIQVSVVSESGNAEIKKGEVAIFITSADDNVLFFENTDHGFYIEL